MQLFPTPSGAPTTYRPTPENNVLEIMRVKPVENRPGGKTVLNTRVVVQVV
jgi:hypothetical protein